jgi:hypothetical protein
MIIFSLVTFIILYVFVSVGWFITTNSKTLANAPLWWERILAAPVFAILRAASKLMGDE